MPNEKWGLVVATGITNEMALRLDQSNRELANEVRQLRLFQSAMAPQVFRLKDCLDRFPQLDASQVRDLLRRNELPWEGKRVALTLEEFVVFCAAARCALEDRSEKRQREWVPACKG